MRKSMLATLFTCAAATTAAAATIPPAPAPAKAAQTGQSAQPAPPGHAPATNQSARITLNGVEYFYEIRGQGDPLLMLHGGLGVSGMFDPVLPAFTARRQVILVDLQGHGRSTLGNRPIRCESIADDLQVLLTRLGHAKIDVLGYSFGGCVALRLAVQHPASVRRLVLVSTPFADDGWYAEMRAQQAKMSHALAPMMKDTPMYHSYAAIAPKVEDFPRLLDAMGDWMRHKYNWSIDVAKLKMPVMLIYGDSDMVRPEHEIKFYQLLGGGLRDAGWKRESMARNRLAILPDLTHYDIFAAARLADTALPFLNGQSDARSWADELKAQATGGSK
jgi:pimeloyl-ACP methyl ester carboxylesterase